MPSLNKATVIGHLGRDPEMRETKAGVKICSFSVATSRKTKAGEKTEWHRITAWDKLADLCQKYLAKGRLVYVEGRLETDSWEKDGQKKERTGIVAHEVLFLGGRGGEHREVKASQQSLADMPEPPDTGIPDDEIPF